MPRRTAVGAALALALACAGCGDAGGREIEPEMRVRVEGRALGAWIEDAEQGRVGATDAARAVRALTTARGFDDDGIRRRACAAAMAVAKRHDAAAPELVPWLSGHDFDATLVTWALAERTPHVPAAVPPVVALLGSSEAPVRARAATALRNAAGTAGARLESLLADGSTAERAAAAGLLSRYAGKQMIDASERQRLAPAVVGALVELLHDGEPLVRRGAAPCIGAWGAHAVRATPALMDALGSEDDVPTRVHVLQSIASAHSAPDAPPVPPRFVQPLARIALDPREDPSAAANAVRALTSVPDAAEVAAELAARAVDAARSDSAERRARAVPLLGALATRRNGGVDALVAALDDPDPARRRDAVSALWTLRDGGDDVIAALCALRERAAGDTDLIDAIETTLRRLDGR